MKIVGRFFEQLGDDVVSASSVRDQLYHASTRTVVWVNDRNRIIYVQDGVETALQPSYGTVRFIHAMERLDAVLTIEEGADKLDVIRMYALNPTSTAPVAATISIGHNQVTSITSCAITGNILAVHHNRCWLLQPESPLTTDAGVVVTTSQTRYVPFLELDLDTTPVATAVCDTHLAFQTSPREISLYQWHVRDNADGKPQAFDADNADSNANEDGVDMSEAICFNYNAELQLPVKECNNLTLFLPGVEGVDHTQTASELLGPLDCGDHRIFHSGAPDTPVTLTLQLRRRLEPDDTFHQMQLWPCYHYTTQAKGCHRDEDTAVAQGNADRDDKDDKDDGPDKVDKTGHDGNMLFDGVGLFISASHQGAVYHATTQRVVCAATYAYALPDPAIAAVATPLRVFVLCRDSSGVVQSYTSRFYQPDIRAGDAVTRCQQLVPGLDGLATAPSPMPQVLWIGSDTVAPTVCGLTVSEKNILLLLQNEEGSFRVAVKPLLTSLDLFEQVSTYADQTPQAHPNVFHMLSEINLQLRTAQVHQTLIAPLAQTDQLSTVWMDSCRRLLNLPCQPIRQAALALVAQPEWLPQLLLDFAQAELTTDTARWPLVSLTSHLILQLLQGQTAARLALEQVEGWQQLFLTALAAVCPTALTDSVLLLACCQQLHLSDAVSVKETLITITPMTIATRVATALVTATSDGQAARLLVQSLVQLEAEAKLAELESYPLLVIAQDGQPGPLLALLEERPEFQRKLLLAIATIAPVKALDMFGLVSTQPQEDEVLFVLALLADLPRWTLLPVDQRAACLQRVFQAYLMELSEQQLPKPLPRPPVGLVERPPWLDLLPPYAPGYVPGVAASAAVLSQIRLLQALLWYHSDATTALALLDTLEDSRWKTVPGLLALEALLLAKSGKLLQASRLLLVANPACVCAMLDNCPVECKLLTQVYSMVNALTSQGEGDRVSIASTEQEKHLFSTVLVPRAELKAVVFSLLQRLGRYYKPMELLALMPDDGDAFQHLPLLGACMQREAAETLQQKLVQEATQVHVDA
eukprot:m.272666 g.272666  ORF g.272666 m.272666 type:complete len:1039 (-) comp17679_c0_seq1:2942-6058(-)